MKLIFSLAALTVLCAPLTSQAADGLLALKSPRPAQETMDRTERAVTTRGLKVFARIDHAAGAATIGQQLRPTELLIFGDPKGGTPLMACGQSAGIDLPLKALVWEDASGQVWLGYNDPAYLVERHHIADCAAAVAENIGKSLHSLASEVLGPEPSTPE
ncbi:DUF302 domain-containing protein [Arenimonas alkanexedens]